MLPLLLLCADGEEHEFGDAVNALADQFRLTDEELAELLPSGRYPRFRHRVGWARTDLVKAGLLESTARGRFRIAPAGKQALAAPPPAVDRKYLRRFPSFARWEKTAKQESTDAVGVSPGQTPEESTGALYESLRATLAADLLETVKGCSPSFFEQLVVDLLVAMGYGGSHRDAGKAVGRTSDEGIDGIIKEDRLGLDAIYLQAKRWDGVVGSPVVHAFVGALEGRGAAKGVLITTSRFSREATDYVAKVQKKVVLIDGEELAQLMIDHGVGVSAVSTYTVKKIDADYFDGG